MVTEVLALLPTPTNDYEALVVDDGNEDRPGTVLDELARTLTHVRVIHHPANRGCRAAIRSGLSHTGKDLSTDEDGQYNVRELAALVPLLTDEVDIVNGYKIKRADHRRRIVLGAIYNWLAHLLFRVPIRDVDCDFRLTCRRAIEQIKLVSSSGVVCTGINAQTPRCRLPFRRNASASLPARLRWCLICIGGARRDEGYSVAVDSLGYAYVAGLTTSNQTTFPVHGGHYWRERPVGSLSTFLITAV